MNGIQRSAVTRVGGQGWIWLVLLFPRPQSPSRWLSPCKTEAGMYRCWCSCRQREDVSWGLKALDTFGNCQRTVFSLGVSQHMHKNNKSVKIWTQLVRKWRKKKYPCCTNVCAFRFLRKAEGLKVQILRYFRESRVSQCFILSTALHCQLPDKFLLLIFWVITKRAQCL